MQSLDAWAVRISVEHKLKGIGPPFNGATIGLLADLRRRPTASPPIGPVTMLVRYGV